MEYDMNITNKGENILKKLANDKRIINYKNLFFKTGNPSIDNYDYYKGFGTLYNLFKRAVTEQSETITKLEELKIFVLLEEKSINEQKSRGAMKKAKAKAERRKIISSQKSVIKNAIKLHD